MPKTASRLLSVQTSVQSHFFKMLSLPCFLLKMVFDTFFWQDVSIHHKSFANRNSWDWTQLLSFKKKSLFSFGKLGVLLCTAKTAWLNNTLNRRKKCGKILSHKREWRISAYSPCTRKCPIKVIKAQQGLGRWLSCIVLALQIQGPALLPQNPH